MLYFSQFIRKNNSNFSNNFDNLLDKCRGKGGAIITSDLPDNVFAGGIPCKVIKTL